MRHTILIVEDEALLRLNAIDFLEDAGFCVVAAADAETALKTLEVHPEISVLFTDVNMPGSLDGLELARQVHALRPNIELIITSGREAPKAADIPAAGHFIRKPYDFDALASMLARPPTEADAVSK